MKYVVYELVVIKKNSYDDQVWALDTVWPGQSKYDTKQEAVDLIKKLKATKLSFERFFTILEVY